MIPDYNGRMELAGLAHRRYPNMQLPMALLCFESDRRKAGLGALDECLRGTGKGRWIGYRKWVENFTGRVVYEAIIEIPPHYRVPRIPALDLCGSLITAETCIQATWVPARSERMHLPVDSDVFRTQSGRRYVARQLWRMRKTLREGGKSQ